MNPPLHLIDLGPLVDDGVLRELMRNHGRGELVRGMLQTMRETAFDRIKHSKEGVEQQNTLFMASKLAEHTALEDMVQHFIGMMQPRPEDAKSEMESMLGEVPRS